MKKYRAGFRYLSEVTGRLKIHIAYLAVSRAVLAVIGVYYALLLRNVIDAAVAGDREAFFHGILTYVVLAAVQITMRAINRWVTAQATTTLDNRIKARLYSVLLTRDYASVSSVHTGEWMNRLTGDTGTVAGSAINMIPSIVGMFVRLIGAIIVIAMLEPRFLYIIIPVGVIVILVSAALRNILKNMYLAIRESDGRMRMFLQESLGNMLVIRSYGAEDDMTERAEERMDDFKATRMRRVRFSNFCNTGYSAVMRCASVLVVALCGYGILIGTITYGTFTAITTLIGEVQGPISNLSGILPRFYTMMAGVDRLMEAEGYPEQEEYSYELPEIQQRYNGDFHGFGLDRICFSYLPPVQGKKVQMPVVLENFTVEIEKGEYVALVGPSGCGKSTMLKLLMSLYPLDAGERYVLLDEGKEPLDARWRRLFAYVPQGNQLMSGTIREIIAFSDEEDMRDDKRIMDALQTACALEFVSEMEEGIDTELGERGAGLSEGQMQRLAIARAVFSERPILLLDECTSSLDADTESRLLTNLREMTDRTVLIVTHRAAALSICDKIVEFTADGCNVRPSETH